MKKERILNVGCGGDTYGTDFIDIYPSRKGVKRVDIQNEKFPYKSNTFDEVYSRCVLEHCISPGNVILEMKRVLKKGGRLKIITDNANYWAFALKNTSHRGSYELKEKSDDRHYALFTDWHLANYFKKFGIKIIKIEYTDKWQYNLGRNRFIIFLKRCSKVINFFIRLTPLRTMSYIGISIEGEKI